MFRFVSSIPVGSNVSPHFLSFPFSFSFLSLFIFFPFPFHFLSFPTPTLVAPTLVHNLPTNCNRRNPTEPQQSNKDAEDEQASEVEQKRGLDFE
jgi:hypothetical protein